MTTRGHPATTCQARRILTDDLLLGADQPLLELPARQTTVAKLVFDHTPPALLLFQAGVHGDGTRLRLAGAHAFMARLGALMLRSRVSTMAVVANSATIASVVGASQRASTSRRARGSSLRVRTRSSRRNSSAWLGLPGSSTS